MAWKLLNPRVNLGPYLPQIISSEDPRTIKEQINAKYAHGGGFMKFEGFTFDPKTKSIQYPGDPVFKALAEIKVRDETAYYYTSDWVVVVQKTGEWEATRMD